MFHLSHRSLRYLGCALLACLVQASPPESDAVYINNQSERALIISSALRGECSFPGDTLVSFHESLSPHRDVAILQRPSLCPEEGAILLQPGETLKVRALNPDDHASVLAIGQPGKPGICHALYVVGREHSSTEGVIELISPALQARNQLPFEVAQEDDNLLILFSLN